MLKLKRVFAFVLDMVFLSFLSILLVNSPLLKLNIEDIDKYNKAMQEKVVNMNIEEIDKQENPYKYMQDNFGQELYDSTKSQGYVLIIYLCIHFLYFVVFAYFNQGRTLGCVFMKLKIVNKDNNKPNPFNLLFRSIFVGSNYFFIFPLTTVLFIIIPRVLSVQAAYYPIIATTGIMTMFELVLFGFFLFNKKDMTIQDYIAQTKIIEYKR